MVKPVSQHIEDAHSGSRAAFARACDVLPQQVTKWINGGFKVTAEGYVIGSTVKRDKTVKGRDMKIITMSEEMGLIYYTAKDYKYDDVFVVVYGLQVKQFHDRDQAEKEVKNCLDHYWESSK